MMKPSLSPLLIPLILQFAAPQAFGDDEPLSCADRSVTAHAVRTTEDVQAFVQCACMSSAKMGHFRPSS